MIEITQTILHDPDKSQKGNCFAACVASILELPLEKVPHFVEHENWLDCLQSFLKEWGLFYAFVSEEDKVYCGPWGYHVINGVSDRGIRHSVVGHAGEPVWDPHPSRSGLTGDWEAWTFGVFAQLDPAQV